MNFLRIENNKKSTVLTTLSVLLPFTFVYKLWFEAELIFNTVALSLGSYMGRVLSYCVNGAIGYLLAFAAIGWSYNIFARSKYSPCDENFVCKINKPTYTAIGYFVVCIANILGGTLNFIAYAAPISIVFVTILLPKLVTIIAVCAFVALLCLECKKEERRQLLTAMAIPCIILLLLLR